VSIMRGCHKWPRPPLSLLLLLPQPPLPLLQPSRMIPLCHLYPSNACVGAASRMGG
jgi:hypothetical protein